MPQDATPSSYSAIYAFGDSLSDAGNLSIATSTLGATEPVSPPYFKGTYGSITADVFSNGPTWVQDLSASLGLGTLAPSLLGGTNFAFGGAETGLTPQNSNPGDADLQAISLPSQLLQFQAAVPSPGALYTLSIGSNDLLDILADTSLGAQQQTTDVNDAVANEIGFVQSLVGDGANNLLVLDVPDLGVTPDVENGLANGTNMPSAAFDSLATQLSAEYNADLTQQLASLSTADAVRVNVVDAFQNIDNAIANPVAFGLANVTTPVWSGNFTSASSGTLTTTDVATQDQSLFFDHLHPTESGHQELAALAGSQLNSNATNPGLAVEDTTTNQAPPSLALPYIGPVSGLQEQYINLSSDNLNISAATPDWFLHGGSGNDALAVSDGTNVLDGGTGSNFLAGGIGADTFFVDSRGLTADIWSTVANFHGGDSVTVFGVTPSDVDLNWVDKQGAEGFTGLTLHASAAGEPTASLTLVGYAMPDLTNGRLSVSFGSIPTEGTNYLSIHANG